MEHYRNNNSHVLKPSLKKKGRRCVRFMDKCYRSVYCFGNTIPTFFVTVSRPKPGHRWYLWNVQLLKLRRRNHKIKFKNWNHPGFDLFETYTLRALYTFGNCQRQVLSLGVAQLRLQAKYRVRNYLFLKNYVTWEGVVSHNVLYYQQLAIACYQVSFANIYFE